MSSTVGTVTSGLSKLNPFSKRKVDDEDKGDVIEPDSVGGGGHAYRKSKLAKNELRVSVALKSFLAKQGILTEDQASGSPDHLSPALKELIEKPHIRVPPELTDRSQPLSEYFVSSSHNTYLMAHQLYGSASAVAYETALNTGSRCVEIDAWDNDDDKQEPKVTHGYTLAQHIPFRKVCETMRDIVDKEAADSSRGSGYGAGPIMLSLENHCSAQGQKRLVEIMKEVWGDRLISKHVRDQGSVEEQGVGKVTLNDLGSKIAVIVEYFFPDEPDHAEEEEEEVDPEEDETAKKDRKEYEEQKKKAPKGIIPELAELGVYAQSVKPRDHSWFESELKGGPHDHLINVSETQLAALMPGNNDKVGKHNAHHLMRVFPKGTRISSQNQNPVPFWGIGAQICALNWQTFDASMQLNEALFSGTDGYLLKPKALRAGGSGQLNTGRKKKLRLHVAGVTDIPLPEDREKGDIKPYVTCTLVHPDRLDDEHPKKKTSPYKQHKLGIVHRGENPPPTNALWDETLEWSSFDENELTFLRILVKSDDSFARNPVLAVAAVRLLYVTEGWSFVRMLDLKGRETKCSLLLKFDIEDA